MLDSDQDLYVNASTEAVPENTVLFMRACKPCGVPGKSIAILILAVLLLVGIGAFGELIYMAHRIHLPITAQRQ